MALGTIEELKAAAKEIGEFGLRGLSADLITHSAVQSGSLSHLCSALYAIVYFNYFDKRQSEDTNPEKFLEYFEKIIDAIAELNPYEAIISCFRSYPICDTAMWEYLDFDEVILPTAIRYVDHLGMDDAVRVILLLGNEQTASNPPSEAPVYYDMLRQLAAQVARGDAQKAHHVAQYMLKAYPKVPEFLEIFKPYLNLKIKTQPTGKAECK